ncbi:AraC family transcriptional regulator [Amycolatopsis sp. NPDC021455]|uniref:helix-turn-helix transcriptional regulator n=1 Tax=Amycolatopsis sp. NPDC021455 TaxID=3154901 RepID=UPI0033FFA53D
MKTREATGTSEDAHLWAVGQALRRIKADLGGTHSLDELARVAYLSPFHFHRVFRQITSATPARFLAALRIAEAKRLLLGTKANVTTICMDVGYSSLGTFTTQFTRLVGTSPRHFRRLARDLAALPLEEVLAGSVPVEPQRAAPLRIRLSGLPNGHLALVGLFESGIPQGWPAACTLVRGSAEGDLRIGVDGSYMALVMSLPADAAAEAALTEVRPDQCRVGSWGPVHVRRGRPAQTDVEIVLRPRRASDPPILSVSPLLAAGRRPHGTFPKMREPGPQPAGSDRWGGAR